MLKKKHKITSKKIDPNNAISLKWLKAAYDFHTFAYRDPRSAFSSATGSPVVSPTTVLLGIVSTLFGLGEKDKAQKFIRNTHLCKVVVDSPIGVIFFRAFHQLKRYETDKYGQNPRIGLTKINQGTREYGLVEGQTTIFVGLPESLLESVKLALLNLGHLGTHDSMCSIIGDVEISDEPRDVIYFSPEEWKTNIPESSTAVSLSRFKGPLNLTLSHWYLAGGDDTEIVAYFIKGRFEGTTRGKIYKKY
jgi:hypothetical protein